MVIRMCPAANILHNSYLHLQLVKEKFLPLNITARLFSAFLPWQQFYFYFFFSAFLFPTWLTVGVASYDFRGTMRFGGYAGHVFSICSFFSSIPLNVGRTHSIIRLIYPKSFIQMHRPLVAPPILSLSSNASQSFSINLRTQHFTSEQIFEPIFAAYF